MKPIPPSPIAKAKAALRGRMMSRRDELDEGWRRDASAGIARRALASQRFATARGVGAYASLSAEVGTRDLIAGAFSSKGFIALPRVDRTSDSIVFHAVRELPMVERIGAFGIVEPDPKSHPEVVGAGDLDLIFVPGVAFDRSGYRLGYGRGYYDRWLEGAARPYAIGLAWAFQVTADVHAEPHDIPVDAVLTEEGFVELERRDASPP